LKTNLGPTLHVFEGLLLHLDDSSVVDSLVH